MSNILIREIAFAFLIFAYTLTSYFISYTWHKHILQITLLVISYPVKFR